MIERLKIHKFKILAGILGLLLVMGIGVKEKNLKPSETRSCRQNTDCALAIRLDECCSCPQAISREEFSKDRNLEEYRFGEDYSLKKTVDCQNISCQPCASLSKNIICRGGKCLTEERVFCQNPRPEVCTMECIQNPPYICGSDGKFYCNKCATCANPRVEWYVVQDNPCIKE